MLMLRYHKPVGHLGGRSEDNGKEEEIRDKEGGEEERRQKEEGGGEGGK